MKLWRVVTTAPDGKGGGEEYQNRWQAEQAFEQAKASGNVVTLAEFYGNRQIEIVRDSRFEEKQNGK